MFFWEKKSSNFILFQLNSGNILVELFRYKMNLYHLTREVNGRKPLMQTHKKNTAGIVWQGGLWNLFRVHMGVSVALS